MLQRRFVALWLCVFVILVIPLGAQEATLSGPISGFVYEASSRSIRPIMGIPGASYLGDSLIGDLDWAAVAPDGRAALTLKGDHVYLVGGLDSVPTWTRIEGALRNPDRGAWNANASAAVIYSAPEGRLQFLRNLRSVPIAEPPVELSGRVSALASDRSGDCAVVGLEGEQDGGLYVVRSSGPPKLVARLGHPAAIALSASEQDLFVADRGSRRILEVRDYRETATVMLFADYPGQAWDPVGLALSGDGQLLFLANRSEKSLTAYAVASRTPYSELALDYEPSLLEPLSPRSLFLLKSGGADREPLLVLDAGREPVVHFVPVGKGE